MVSILIVCSSRERFKAFSSRLEEGYDVSIEWAERGVEALSVIKERKFGLVIAYEQLDDMTGLVFAEKLVKVSPITNCVLVSGLSPGDFHEASEGLGVLMAIPPEPEAADASTVMDHLERILKVVNASGSTA